MSSRQTIPGGARCIISGWGLLTKYALATRRLQWGVTPVLSDEKCTPTQFPTRITNIHKDMDNVICAKSQVVDSCVGDSGGPLVCQVEENGWHIAGIVSWGIGACGNTKYPSVYTDVRSYREWIANKTGIPDSSQDLGRAVTPKITITTTTATTTTTDFPITIFNVTEMDTGTCGRTIFSQTPASRILGGENAEHGKFPWQVLLRTRSFICGGTLLTESVNC